MSPDADLEYSKLPQGSSDNPSVEWIANCLISFGVMPALGHFTKQNPEASADCIDQVVEACRPYYLRYGTYVITDHLFNDMPLLFTNSWRTDEARRNRNEELKAMELENWTLDNLKQLAGPVPAKIMQLAAQDCIALCLNFDGEHVDKEISKRAVELVGSNAIIAMTDRTHLPRLGGQNLVHKNGNQLWYQDTGIVAAGSQTLYEQARRMETSGIRVEDAENMMMNTPRRVFKIS
jgi:hypothetical protein